MNKHSSNLPTDTVYWAKKWSYNPTQMPLMSTGSNKNMSHVAKPFHKTM